MFSFCWHCHGGVNAIRCYRTEVIVMVLDCLLSCMCTRGTINLTPSSIMWSSTTPPNYDHLKKCCIVSVSCNDFISNLIFHHRHHCSPSEVVEWVGFGNGLCLFSLCLLIDSASKSMKHERRKLQVSPRITTLGRVLLLPLPGQTNCQVNTHVIKQPINTPE